MLRELQALAADVEPGRAPWHHQPCGQRVFFSTTEGRTLLLDGTAIKSTEIEAIACPCGEPVSFENVLVYYADWWLRNEVRFFMRGESGASDQDRAWHEANISWPSVIRAMTHDHLIGRMWAIANAKQAAKAKATTRQRGLPEAR